MCVNCDPRCVAELMDHADRAVAACGAVLATHKKTYVPLVGAPIETLVHEYCKCIRYQKAAS